ncbi:ETC complex I subunit [Insolitispirillum peregrinum]|uniref:ETC complex I subunit conserved region n=1 Tax=Insolitispirillum peregrinum TaxID=80876 RepID=A0A1N7IMM0_9PROT|nr:ETC complex I subunit [Insolitispirillum peregrinum]SIS38325.1 ETC complex I subunit conserved region [Insolitispirillum peregrinum]
MATVVRIYRPAKTAMQSGRGNLKAWVLEFEPTDAKKNDPLMGWAGSRDTRNQLRLRFDSKDAAIAYAQRNGFVVRLHEPTERTVKPKNYADNFAFNRVL